MFINSTGTLHDCAVTLSIDYEISLCQLFNITNCLHVVSVHVLAMHAYVSVCVCVCFHDVNMQEVNACVPVSSCIHSA